MSIESECTFCDPASLEWRTIRSGKLFLSFVSSPWFRQGHCLVVPKRHIEAPHELTKDEGGEIMYELGRIGLALDNGYGTGITQKFTPLQPENGIKMNHLHFHVFPRDESEQNLFPVPEPNSFEGLTIPTDDEILMVVNVAR